MRISALSAALLMGLAQVAQGATLSEADIAGGFSSDFANPTNVALNTTSIDGTLSNGDPDFFQLSGLESGSQTLFFFLNLAAPNGLTGAQSASGQIRVNETAFSSAIDGTRINSGAGVDDFNLAFDPADFGSAVPFQTLSYDLGTGFGGGDLYLSILPTFASQMFSFGVVVPASPIAPAPVPVPAAGLMLLAALGGFAALRRRKPNMLPA